MRKLSPLLCLLVLAGLLAVCAIAPVPGAIAMVLAGLLATEIDRSGALLAVPIVRLAALGLPRRMREHLLAEWTDHVLSAGEEGTRPLMIALVILVAAAPRLIARQRIGPRVGEYLLATALTIVNGQMPLQRSRPRTASEAVRLLFLIPCLALALEFAWIESIIFVVFKRRPVIWRPVLAGAALMIVSSLLTKPPWQLIQHPKGPTVAVVGTFAMAVFWFAFFARPKALTWIAQRLIVEPERLAPVYREVHEDLVKAAQRTTS